MNNFKRLVTRLQNLSLRLRLTLLFLLLASITWLSASIAAWKQTTDELDILFDSQQMQFAKRLSIMDFDELADTQLQSHELQASEHKNLDDKALAFAIYSHSGQLLLQDSANGRRIPYSYQQDGFDNGYLEEDTAINDHDEHDNEEWRFLWITSPDGEFRIVVGQEWDYRQDIALDIITSQLTPWLIALPLIVIALIVLISRELSPLKKLTFTLSQRSPEVDEQLNTQDVPTEVRPLVEALNQLFVRTQNMMQRERRFTSDAAHELRSPLTALKVQTEVAQLSDDDAAARGKALAQLHTGIDRAARLVAQLLTLSRLDSLDSLTDIETISMATLLETAIIDIYHPALQAGIDIRLQVKAQSVIRQGQPLLLGLLVRNLLDNAVRYSPTGSIVDVTLDGSGFSIRDNGTGVANEALAQIGQRFYRPAGQQQTGSGLGLSIVKRIAELHRMTATFRNYPQGGFIAEILW